jgi:hypothetical protein
MVKHSTYYNGYLLAFSSSHGQPLTGGQWVRSESEGHPEGGESGLTG